MKNKIDNILEIGFKIGKILSTILLLVVFITIVVCGIRLFKANSKVVETPNFNSVKQHLLDSNKYNTVSYNDTTQSDSNSLIKYEKTIDAIISKNKLDPKIYSEIKKHIDKIPENYVKQYLKGLNKFYKEGLSYLNYADESVMEAYFKHISKKYGAYGYDYYYDLRHIQVDNVYNYNLCLGLLHDYSEIFTDNISNTNRKFQEEIETKITLAIVLSISLLIFMILLFLPVLLKIEENTRNNQGIDNQDNVTTEEYKICVHCGKQIKLNAQKCRYCGEWQNDERIN